MTIISRHNKGKLLKGFVISLVVVFLVPMQVWAYNMTTADVRAYLTSAGGEYHYNVYGEGITSDTQSSGSITSIETKVYPVRNGVVQGMGKAISYDSNTVTKTMGPYKEYDTATWEVYNYGTTIYLDGSVDESTGYDYEYVNY